MSNWVRKLFESLGLKRKIAGFLAALGPVLQQNPQLTFLVPYADWLAGLFGIAGLGHATVGQTITQVPAATLSSVFSVLLLLTHVVPALAEYDAIVRTIAALFGVSIVLTSRTKLEAREELNASVRRLHFGPQ